MPKVSVITVCLNAASTIAATIASVAGQTYIDYEYIVIDGGSTDGTVSILQACREQGKLKFSSGEDRGIYDAMNKGIEQATGEWLYFLGSDDVLLNDDVLAQIFSEPIHAEEIIYGNVQFLHTGIIYDGPFDSEKISVKNICQQCIFYKRSLFKKLGLFSLKYKIYADHEFNIKWMGAGVMSRYINLVTCIYNEKGISGKVIDETFVQEYDNLLINNNIVSERSFYALKRKHAILQNSYSYKLGRFITYPAIWLKSKLSHF